MSISGGAPAPRAAPSAAKPEPASTTNNREPQRTSTQGVCPPNSQKRRPDVDSEPRTPQKRT
jgi:hypothetical protein